MLRCRRRITRSRLQRGPKLILGDKACRPVRRIDMNGNLSARIDRVLSLSRRDRSCRPVWCKDSNDRSHYGFTIAPPNCEKNG